MQESDLKAHGSSKLKDTLDSVAQLFEQAGKSDKGKDDDEFWTNRLKEFGDQALKEHKGRLQIFGHGDAEKQEVWRARYALYTIADERLDTILRAIDPNLEDVSKRIREGRLHIFQEVIAETSNLMTGLTVPDEPISIGSSELSDEGDPDEEEEENAEPQKKGGIAAFARAARMKGTDIASSGGKNSMTPKSPASMRMTAMHVNAKNYDDALSDDGTRKLTTISRLGSTVGSFVKSPLSMIYGTANTNMRGGPAMLGAGPQDTSIRKPEPISNQSYTTLHKIRLSKRPAKGGQQVGGAPVTRPGKDLSLRQLREVIQSVYKSKQEYDAECRARQEPTETMEQHLYGYLGMRYALKSAIQEWTSVIFKAIQKYATRESDVAVFGKVLQNTLSESFPVVQDTCRETVQQLLMKGLMESYPNRPQGELDALFRARTRCGFPLRECRDVVNYMYNESDADKLMVKLVHCSKHPVMEPHMEPLAPDCVRLKDLTQVLLSFQMALTESFLSEFVLIFGEIDTDKDGILALSELEELVRRVGYVEDADEGTNAATVLVEAKGNTFTSLRNFKKGATFSECVDMFTGLISARWGVINPPL